VSNNESPVTSHRKSLTKVRGSVPAAGIGHLTVVTERLLCFATAAKDSDFLTFPPGQGVLLLHSPHPSESWFSSVFGLEMNLAAQQTGWFFCRLCELNQPTDTQDA